ncbi:hypothetical protein HPULCUR_005592 [Helicostylum pulchrum]|uniref:C2H2-type domain-containing protein n=1 Tax=Helicostylum pulchrum TaxID=562976 RepID=A0ABP9Y1H6_9FUNG
MFSFTVYFEIIESTLLVEALRVDYTRLPEQSFCEHCGMVLNSSNQSNRHTRKHINDQVNNINIPERTSARAFDRSSVYSDIPFITIDTQRYNGTSSQMTSNV